MNGLDGDRLLINLVVTIVAVAITMAITMAVGLKKRNHSVVDITWGLGFVVIAAVSYVASIGTGDLGRRTVVVALVAIWGLRLGWYILRRNKGHVDIRYELLMKRNQGSEVAYVIRKIYGMQGALMWFVSLPVQLAMYESRSIGVLGAIGIALWVVGFGFEAIGDRQLKQFKADPGNAGKTLDSGLWGWTRHPNYFGDAVMWFGLWFLSLGHWLGVLTIICPIAMTHFLVNKSGKALTEKLMSRKRGPEFELYVAEVSGFFPRPRRHTTP